MKTILLAATLLLLTTLAHAGGQDVIPEYAVARRDFFWTQLYVNGGRSIYCNIIFRVFAFSGKTISVNVPSGRFTVGMRIKYPSGVSRS